MIKRQTWARARCHLNAAADALDVRSKNASDSREAFGLDALATLARNGGKDWLIGFLKRELVALGEDRERVARLAPEANTKGQYGLF